MDNTKEFTIGDRVQIKASEDIEKEYRSQKGEIVGFLPEMNGYPAAPWIKLDNDPETPGSFELCEIEHIIEN